MFFDYRENAGLRVDRTCGGPGYFRHVARDTAEHFALEIFDDLRPSLMPPLCGGHDLLAVLERQSVRQVREGIGLGLVVIGVVGRFLIAARTRAEGLDAELIHHVLMVLFHRPVHQQRPTSHTSWWFPRGGAASLLPRGRLRS